MRNHVDHNELCSSGASVRCGQRQVCFKHFVTDEGRFSFLLHIILSENVKFRRDPPIGSTVSVSSFNLPRACVVLVFSQRLAHNTSDTDGENGKVHSLAGWSTDKMERRWMTFTVCRHMFPSLIGAISRQGMCIHTSSACSASFEYG